VNIKEAYNPHLGSLDDIVQKHSDYVTALARKNAYKARNRVDEDDLIQAGMIGLIKAYKKYQPAKDAKFEAYAYFHIKKEIIAFIRDHSEAIRPARDVYEIAGSVMKQGLRENDPEQIAKKLGCTIRQAQRAIIHLDKKSEVSLNVTIATESGWPVERLELLETYQDFTQVFVNDFMQGLNQSEIEYVKLLSLDMSQKEIGKAFGISQVHAGRQIKKLRSRAHNYFWGDEAWTG
jgi:RNA polymerase sigma factor (sigma-70 family)